MAGAGPADVTAVLQLVSKPRLQLGFGERVVIEAKLLDAAGNGLARVPVSFALMGRPQDASLEEVEVQTDDSGHVQNGLVAGETPGTFRVRLSAPGASELFVDVAVSNAGFGTLEVAAPYEGPRAVHERLVVVQAGADCAGAEAMDGDPMMVLGADGPDGTARFLALPADASYAVSVFAEGRDGTVLAQGCVDSVVVKADDAIAITVNLVDEALMPAGLFVLAGDLESSEPASALARAVREGAAAAVRGEASPLSAQEIDAAFLLDSLNYTLRGEELSQLAEITVLADALAAERLSPSGELSPEQSLAAALAAAGMAPSLVPAELSTRVVALLERVQLEAELMIDPGNGELPVTWHGQRLWVSDASGAELSVLLSELSQPVATQAAFDSERDLLSVGEVSFPVTFGALAAEALSAVLSVTDGHGAELRTLAGCEVLGPWLGAQVLGTSDPLACDAACLQAACDRSMTRIRSGAEQSLMALDAARPELTLSGELLLGDDDGDLLAERMHTELLSGLWQPAEGELEGDAVAGPASAAMVEVEPPVPAL
ncbi:MAG: hypothetical protein OEZ06_24100 [Myxococcales bacterium]|nr:hypothetical protein [Myxococcales bacterium]